jgi:uncharacterized cupredoxin-like copper-binding protein
MVRCKNAGGAPSDGDESPPRRIEVARGKRVKIAAKKRKRTLIEAEVAQAVAEQQRQQREVVGVVVYVLARVAFTLKVDSSV